MTRVGGEVDGVEVRAVDNEGGVEGSRAGEVEGETAAAVRLSAASWACGRSQENVRDEDTMAFLLIV